MGMTDEECVITDDAVTAIVDLYKENSGCRDLEQAAEHLAANALYKIETQQVSGVTFTAEDVKNILE